MRDIDAVDKFKEELFDELGITVNPKRELLFSAAPELYESLAAVVSWYDRNKPLPYEENGIQMIIYYAKKALAKASGEEVKVMNANSITIIINHLNEARAYAVISGLDHHFISEIDHLIATAEANMEDEK